MSKSLLFLTGTRADFGKIAPLAAAARDAGYQIRFFVTGMHMLSRYGRTVKEVHRFEGAVFHEFINQKEGDPHDLVMAKTMLGFSDLVSEEPPDLVIVHGDRIEALAVATVCATRYIPCAHIEGGEVSGTIDELYRHCNSKLCRYHFVSSDQARDRVLSLGESREDVFVLGSPELDLHRRPSGVSLQDVRARYNIPFDDFGIAVFHPVTSEIDTIGEQAAQLFGALECSGHNFVVISPNNDPGSREIFDIVENLPNDRFRHLPSMRFAHFSELMRNASCVVGNSSIGVREAPFVSVPSLDIGSRQSGRAQSSSVFHASPFDRTGILNLLRQVWGKRLSSDMSFGEGDAASRFVQIIDNPDFWVRDRQKYFVDQAAA